MVFVLSAQLLPKMDKWPKRNLYQKKKKGTPKHEHFSSSLWLSSSEGPCVLSGNGEPGNIPGSAGPEEIVWLWFDEVSWMKNYDYSTTDDENTLSILPWLECDWGE